LKRPVLSAGPLKDLNDALHELHLDAGLPTLTAMYRELGKGISRSSLHDALTGTGRPSWETVEALVEILATRSPRTSAEQEVERFHDLWVEAARSVVAGSSAPDSVPGDSVQTASHAPLWIMAIDIHGFGHALHEYGAMRERLFEDVDEALDFANIKAHTQIADRGDSLSALVPMEHAPLGSVLGFLLHLQRLTCRQGTRVPELRLRVALSQGTARISEMGWIGSDLNQVFRLLDAAAFRDLMAKDSSVLLAVAIAQHTYDELDARAPHGFRHEYKQLKVATKDGPVDAWAYTAGRLPA
jgi:hypothetical protein